MNAPSTATVTTATPEFFETIYAEARGDASVIPWEDGQACPFLVSWLNVVAPSLIRCGARVAVVGCGLGHDVRELLRRGYDVTGFDCSETAVTWAHALDPTNTECYVQADLFNPPSHWRHRFDLVVEIYTLQAIRPDRRTEAMRQVADMLSPHGHLLMICRGCDEPAALDAGPPWAFTPDELRRLAADAGLHADGDMSDFMDDEDPPVRRLRTVFVRGTGD